MDTLTHLPTGAAWWVAQVDAGKVSGRGHRHGDPATWLPGATRTSLELALQGYIVKTARRTACPGP